MMNKRSVACWLLCGGCSLLVACQGGVVASIAPTEQAFSSVVPSPTSLPTPMLTVTAEPTPTTPMITAPPPASPTPTLAPTVTLLPTASMERAAAGTAVPQSACQRPPDDYSLVEVNGWVVNVRTHWMLQLAQVLYAGPGSILRITQGSYTSGEPGSFGTHDGGGVVDISIRHPTTLKVLWGEAEPMVLALRQAGFAAWYRAPGDLWPGAPAHIHAVAIGDRDLSPAAREQLEGEWGYFRGMDGIPPPYGGPHPDRHGGKILCDWMLELGYNAVDDG